MCVPMNAAYSDRIRAEIARARGVTAPKPMPTFSRSIRAVPIDSPMGRMTFYVRERQRVRGEGQSALAFARRVLALVG